MQQLRAVVLMPRLTVAMGVIMSKGDQRAMGKREGCGGSHSDLQMLKRPAALRLPGVCYD